MSASVSPCAWLSIFTLSWASPLIHRGVDVTPADFFALLKAEETDAVGGSLRDAWASELRAHGREGASLTRAFASAFWRHYISASSLLFLKAAFFLASTQFLGSLLDALADASVPAATAYSAAAGLVGCAAAAAMLHHHFFFLAWRAGMRWRVAASSVVFEKSLSLSLTSLSRVSAGGVVSIVSGDFERLTKLSQMLCYVVLAPIETVVILWLIWERVGPSALAGLGAIVVFVSWQGYFSKWFGQLRTMTAKLSDERLRLTSAVVTGARVYKAMGWEARQRAALNSVRDREVAAVRAAAKLRAVNEGASTAAPFVTSAAIFIARGVSGGVLRASDVFVCMTLIAFLQVDVAKFFAAAIEAIAETNVTFTRLRNFLLLEEPEIDAISPTDADVVLNVDNLGAAWGGKTDSESTSASESVVSGIRLQVKRGELVAVVGPVGCGKSALLLSILGELRRTAGSVDRVQRVGFSSQPPFLMTDTVKDAITLGRGGAVDAARYARILRACALRRDFSMWPRGDETRIGERGVTLSGGQKARVALARVAYAGGDLFLLDDPLSAVDATVGTTIFDRLIRRELCGRENAGVVLVTHQLQFLSRADRVVVLSAEGTICASGTWAELSKRASAELEAGTPSALGGALVALLVSESSENDTPTRGVSTGNDGALFSHVASAAAALSGSFGESTPTSSQSVAPAPLHTDPLLSQVDKVLSAYAAGGRADVAADALLPLAIRASTVTAAHPLACEFTAYVAARALATLPPAKWRALKSCLLIVTQFAGSPAANRAARVRSPQVASDIRAALSARGARGGDAVNQLRTLPLGQYAARVEDAIKNGMDGAQERTALVASVHEAERAAIAATHGSVALRAGLTAPPQTMPPSTPSQGAQEDACSSDDEEDADDGEDCGSGRAAAEMPDAAAFDPDIATLSPRRAKSAPLDLLIPASPSRLVMTVSTPKKTIEVAEVAVQTVVVSKYVSAQEPPVRAADADERILRSNVSTNVFYRYMRAGGSLTSLCFIVGLVLGGAALNAGSQVALSRWVAQSEYAQREATWPALYGALTLAATVVSVLRAVAFFLAAVRASATIHADAFTRILAAPVSFFDVNPSGRVLNRFSKDVGAMDDQLPWVLFDFLNVLTAILATLGLIAAANAWILLAIVPLALIFAALRAYYMKSARIVKRLEANARSPVFALLAEVLEGLPSLRAARVKSDLRARFSAALDDHSRAYFAFLATSRWLGVRLDALCIALLAASAFGSIGARGTAPPALIGLALSQIIGVTNAFQWCVRQSSEVETLLISVERMLEYVDLSPVEDVDLELNDATRAETGAHLLAVGTAAVDGGEVVVPVAATTVNASPSEEQAPTVTIPINWPRSGSLEFSNLRLRHRAGLPLVLNGVTATIVSGSQVGVVGRTGAGKSSLLAALLRLAEPERNAAGNAGVSFDGVDVARVHLSRLRRAVSYIPQEPLLVEGSLRENVDPFSVHTDDDVWGALNTVKLSQSFQGSSREADGLRTHVSAAGANLSVGQRQLVCLARALLRGARLIVLDEATANVDNDSDALISAALRGPAFANATVIAVAHRLATVIDFNMILVLDAGVVIESGEPHELLQNPNGAFRALVDEGGTAAAAALADAARASYFRRRQ